MGKRLSKEEFIKRAKEVHGNKYDYSNVEYINSHSKVIIKCKQHGEFSQKAYVHLNGHGCPICASNLIVDKNKLTTEEFIKKAKTLYGEKYDYSKVNYVNNSTKVCIICPKHGEFHIRPNDFLGGHSCKKCGYVFLSYKLKHNKEEFIQKAKEIHGNKYDYSKVEYNGLENNVIIICPKHGEFSQKPKCHLNGHGCQKCGVEKRIEKETLTKEEFILKAREVHGWKYDYSKVEYKNNRTKICIICPEHGEFWQIPNSHLNGHGCPKCNEWKMEKHVIEVLNKNNIKYEYKKRNFEWLKYKKPLELDFYLPEYNIAIECQGEQHYKEVKKWGGKHTFEERKNRDTIKQKLCEKNGVKLLYYANYNFNFPYEIIKTDEELLNKIKENDICLQ